MGYAGDALVRGGTVIDGSGAPGVAADVRVRDGRIAELGPALRPDGEPEIDAGGAFVSPGFVDAHTHYDPSLWWDPSCSEMAANGVTAVVIGNCSLSLAPLRAHQRAELAGAFSFIEDLPEEAFRVGIPWSWEDWGDYRAAFDARGSGVGVVGLVGHSVLRLFVMGADAWDRAATAEERDQMVAVLEEAIAAGACGLSISFVDVDSRGRQVPSRKADDRELAALVDVLARSGRVLEFVPSVRDHDEKLEHIERVHRLCAPAGVRATWTQLVGTPDRVEALLDQARRTQQEGPGVWPQYTARPTDVSVSLDRTIAFTFIPAWHKLVQAPREEKLRMLADEWWRDKARTHWDRAKTSFFPNRPGSYDRVRFTSVGPGHEAWLGRTLAERIEERAGHPSDVLADWYLANGLDAGVTARGTSNNDPAQAGRLLQEPSVLVGASDAGAHLEMFSGAGDTTLVLTRHVRDRGDVTIEAAVRRMATEPATFFGLADRGRVAVGAVADLCVFSLDELAYGDETRVTDLPGGGGRLTRPASGFRATLVNGIATWLDGAPSGALPTGFV